MLSHCDDLEFDENDYAARALDELFKIKRSDNERTFVFDTMLELHQAGLLLPILLGTVTSTVKPGYRLKYYLEEEVYKELESN